MTNIDWNRIINKSIYFGHQSVGNNIVQEMNNIIKKNNLTYNVINSKNLSDFNTSNFYHSTIGYNKNPKSKIDEFVKLMDGGLAEKLDIAGFKFCYADIRVNTDINELFDYYTSKLKYLSDKYPNVTFIHFTVPLVSKPRGLKGLIKIFFYDHNAKRNKYNQLVINYYDKNEVFDVAKYESTYHDGQKNIYRKNRLALIDKYTFDGEHPNEFASNLIAQQFFSFLSDIP